MDVHYIAKKGFVELELLLVLVLDGRKLLVLFVFVLIVGFIVGMRTPPLAISRPGLGGTIKGCAS